MRDTRVDTDRYYHAIVNQIENICLGGTIDLSNLLRDWNAVIERFRDILAQETGRRHPVKDLGAGDHCVIEPIDTQKYTEKAVIPIPKAYWREDGKPTVELVFAKDFSVTYKNNVNVGTAEVTLHGTGDYKGQKTVTFNIAR
jgi:hypothetical protein